MIWLTVIVLIVLGVVGYGWWWLVVEGPKPIYHRGITIDQFVRFLESLIETTKVGSFMVIEHEGSERFIQFLQKEGPAGRRAAAFCFPNAPWSRRYFEPLREELDRRGITYARLGTGYDDVPSFLVVDLDGPVSQQVKDAVSLAALAVRAMGLDESSKFTIHTEGGLDAEYVKDIERKAIAHIRRSVRRKMGRKRVDSD